MADFEVPIRVRRLWLAEVWIRVAALLRFVIGPRRAFALAQSGAMKLVRVDIAWRRGRS